MKIEKRFAEKERKKKTYTQEVRTHATELRRHLVVPFQNAHKIPQKGFFNRYVKKRKDMTKTI